MTACEHCLKGYGHAVDCPRDVRLPDEWECAGCGAVKDREDERPVTCFGDIGASVRLDQCTDRGGAEYCSDCYQRDHLRHEDSEAGEDERTRLGIP